MCMPAPPANKPSRQSPSPLTRVKAFNVGDATRPSQQLIVELLSGLTKARHHTLPSHDHPPLRLAGC